MLEQLPHVGAIIPGTDTERVARLFLMIREVIDRRAAEFAQVGAGSITVPPAATIGDKRVGNVRAARREASCPHPNKS